MTTFVFVAGVCCGGWSWNRVAPLLRAAGHDVYTLERMTPHQLAQYAQPVRLQNLTATVVPRAYVSLVSSLSRRSSMRVCKARTVVPVVRLRWTDRDLARGLPVVQHPPLREGHVGRALPSP